MRERSYSWEDPMGLAAAASGRSGLEFLRGIADGELPIPPIMATLGIEGMKFDDGTATFELSPEEWHYNPIGSVHGGVLSTMLDSALACAVHTTLPAGTGYTSLDLAVRFTRAATTASTTLRAEGHVVTRGRRTATAEGRITDPDGRIIATATTTCLILGGES
ncbi:MAG: PaaI family thioesterase [Marmoricola sp.]